MTDQGFRAVVGFLARKEILGRVYEPFSEYEDPKREEWRDWEDCQCCPWYWDDPKWNSNWDLDSLEVCKKGHDLWDVTECSDFPVYRRILFRRFSMEAL